MMETSCLFCNNENNANHDEGPHQLVIKIQYIIFVTVCELTKHCRLESDMMSLAQPALTRCSKLRRRKHF